MIIQNNNAVEYIKPEVLSINLNPQSIVCVSPGKNEPVDDEEVTP